MGKFVIRCTSAGCKFDLKAGNGETIASSEVYESLAACRKGAESVKKCAVAGKIADLTEDTSLPSNPRIELYMDKADQFRFRLRSRNGAIIAVSESYQTKAMCLTGIQSVLQNAPDAEIEEN